jgi:O86/O127-antigen biosynthesis beta-1,3-galactosyltransferase
MSNSELAPSVTSELMSTAQAAHDSTTTAPVISCIMAVHRFDKYVPEAIGSILCQTYTNFEFIIVVNGNPEILEKLAPYTDDRRVRVLFTPIQQLGHSLNIALAAAAGDYIARMDADDVSLPQRFAKQIAVLTAHPELTLVSARTVYIDAAGRELMERRRAPGWANRRLWLKNQINHPAAMFRKAPIIAAGGYASIVAQDYDLWLRLERIHGMFYQILEAPVLKMRNHGAQSRGTVKSYSVGAGLLLREFLDRRDLRFLLGALLMTFRGMLSWRRSLHGH